MNLALDKKFGNLLKNIFRINERFSEENLLDYLAQQKVYRNHMSTSHASPPIEMETLLNDNLVNGKKSQQILRKENYWYYFENTREVYQTILTLKNIDLHRDPCNRARLHYLAGSSIDFNKGISNVISGHFQDSLVFARKTIESARHAIYLRENPSMAELWFSAEKIGSYKKSYDKWLKGNGGPQCESEIPGSREMFRRASSYGPHAGPEQFAMLHEVTFVDGDLNLRLRYNELGNNIKNIHCLLAHYFWHLQVHTCTIDWWIQKSEFINPLSDDQKRHWSNCKSQLKWQLNEINEIISNGPLGNRKLTKTEVDDR